MKLITAIIKPFKLDEVRGALAAIGQTDFTVAEIKSYSSGQKHSEMYRGVEYTVGYIPKLKLELMVADDLVDRVVEAIMVAARTGQVGDGSIAVMSCIEQLWHIRTGQNLASKPPVPV